MDSKKGIESLSFFNLEHFMSKKSSFESLNNRTKTYQLEGVTKKTFPNTES